VSDLRSHEELLAALRQAVKDLYEIEKASGGHDIDANAARVFDRHGFSEWARTTVPLATRMPYGETVTTLRHEHTEVPQFVLLRLRNNAWGDEPSWMWHLYSWPREGS
jgi:hypothetical protein